MLFAYVFRETGVLETKLTALGEGFLVPIFFINVGVTFEWSAVGDLSTLGRSLMVLGAASLLAKLLPTTLLLFLGLQITFRSRGRFSHGNTADAARSGRRSRPRDGRPRRKHERRRYFLGDRDRRSLPDALQADRTAGSEARGSRRRAPSPPV